MRKRIFALILALAMTLCLLPATAFAAAPSSVWVGNDEIPNDGSGVSIGSGTASYYGGVLTLNNINVTQATLVSERDYAAIYADGDLIINLVGASTATGPNSTGNEPSRGLRVTGNLTVRGAGSLTATGGNVDGGWTTNTYGVDCGGLLTAESGTLSGKGGSVQNNYGNSYGLWSNGGIKVTGGILTGTGDSVQNSSGASYGMYTKGIGITLSSGRLTATGGRASDGARSCGVLIEENRITVSGGVFEATGSEATPSNSYGVSGTIGGNQGFDISGGSVTCTGGIGGAGQSYGVYMFSSITLTGGSFRASAAQADYSYGVGQIGVVTVSGGSFHASSSCTAGVGINTNIEIKLLGGDTIAEGNASAVDPADQLVFSDSAQPNGNWYMWKASKDRTEPAAYTSSSIAQYVLSGLSPYDRYLRVVPDPAVGLFSGVTANGSATASTTELTLTFNQDIAGLAASDITLIGATTGTLTKISGQTGVYTLGISDITVADQGTVNVAVAKSGVTFLPASRTVAVRAYTPSITISPAATFLHGNAPNTTVTVGAGVAGFGLDNLSRVEMGPEGGALTTLTSGTDYDAADGSIILTLHQTYLNTLTPGAYTLRVNLIGAEYPSYVETRIIVLAQGADVPKTGDGTMPLLWAGLILLSGAGLLFLRKKRRA